MTLAFPGKGVARDKHCKLFCDEENQFSKPVFKTSFQN